MLREIKHSLMTVCRPTACCGRVWRFHHPIFNLAKKFQSSVQLRTKYIKSLCQALMKDYIRYAISLKSGKKNPDFGEIVYLMSFSARSQLNYNVLTIHTQGLKDIINPAKKFKILTKYFRKIMKSSERPGVSRGEYFVLLFLHELTLNHALRVITFGRVESNAHSPLPLGQFQMIYKSSIENGIFRIFSDIFF